MSGWIDVHAHFTTAEYIAEAIELGYGNPDGMAGYPAWRAADHIALMDGAGIATSVLSMSSPGVHFGDESRAAALARAVNDTAATASHDFPGRFEFFASLPLPSIDASVAELHRSMDELGAKGIIVETNAHGVYLGDERMRPVYEALDEHCGILFIHPTSPACCEATSLGRPRPMIEFMFDTARSVIDLILAGIPAAFPNIRVIVPHAGGVLPLLADRVNGFMSIFGDPNAPKVDVHGALGEFYFDLAGDPFPRLVPALLTLVTEDQVLFGTDYPWTPAPGVARRMSIIEADGAGWRTSTTIAARSLLDRVRSNR